MGYFNALGYKMFIKPATTSSTAPSSSTGMTEVLNLTNAGIQSQSDTQEVLDYAGSLGFKKAVVTAQSYTIPMAMNLDLKDAGYLALRDAADKAATGVTVQWYRESPEMDASGNPQSAAGVAFVTNFSEDIQAGNIAKVTFTLTGYGAPTWTEET